MADTPALIGRSTTRLYKWADGQKVATGAVSAAITASEVMLKASVAVRLAFGPNPVAAPDDGTVLDLDAGERFHLQVTPGEKIWVTAAAAAGFVRITPVA